MNYAVPIHWSQVCFPIFTDACSRDMLFPIENKNRCFTVGLQPVWVCPLYCCSDILNLLRFNTWKPYFNRLYASYLCKHQAHCIYNTIAVGLVYGKLRLPPCQKLTNAACVNYKNYKVNYWKTDELNSYAWVTPVYRIRPLFLSPLPAPVTTCSATSRPHHLCLFSEAVWKRTFFCVRFRNCCSVPAKSLLSLLTL